jgi:hypothetical protein
MGGLEFLDLVIGLIFIYLIYSIASSTLWEMIVNIAHLRGKMLCKWIMNNFSEFNFEIINKRNKKEEHNEILDHPLVKGMTKKSKESTIKPVYISSRIFTDVLMDLVVNSASNTNNSLNTPIDINTFRNSLNNTTLLTPGLKRVFLQYVSEASGSLQYVRDKIGSWYDEAQERLIGSFKKNLQLWIIVISLILVGGTNADTIKLASYLYSNDDAREAIATKASLFVQDSAIVGLVSRIDTLDINSASNIDQQEILEKLEKDVIIINELNQELKQTGIPLGWGNEDLKSFKFWDYVKKIGGLLLTTLAVSMGSPFWFDILSKLSNLRSSGNKPKSSLK